MIKFIEYIGLTYLIMVVLDKIGGRIYNIWELA